MGRLFFSHSLIPKPKYFFVNDGVAKYFRIKKKELFKLFDIEEALLKDYITTKKLKLNAEKDLINFLEFYDGIQENMPQVIIESKE